MLIDMTDGTSPKDIQGIVPEPAQSVDPLERIPNKDVRAGIQSYLTQLGVATNLPEYSRVVGAIVPWAVNSKAYSPEDIEWDVVYALGNGLQAFVMAGDLLPESVIQESQRDEEGNLSMDNDGILPRARNSEWHGLSAVQQGVRYEVTRIRGSENHPNATQDVEGEEWRIRRIRGNEENSPTLSFRIGHRPGNLDVRTIVTPEDRVPFKVVTFQAKVVGVGTAAVS